MESEDEYSDYSEGRLQYLLRITFSRGRRRQELYPGSEKTQTARRRTNPSTKRQNQDAGNKSSMVDKGKLTSKIIKSGS